MVRSHRARLYAEVAGEPTYFMLDPDLNLEAHRYYKLTNLGMPGPGPLLVFELLSKAYSGEGVHERQLKESNSKRSIFDTHLAHEVIFKATKESIEIEPVECFHGSMEVEVNLGYLRNGPQGVYISHLKERAYPFGFSLGVWNGNNRLIPKSDCVKIIDDLKEVMSRDYANIFKVANEENESW